MAWNPNKIFHAQWARGHLAGQLLVVETTGPDTLVEKSEVIVLPQSDVRVAYTEPRAIYAARAAISKR